ncbi:MAG: hypothetical protein ABSB59_44665 [Streptosporangiaceae bacterium]
MSDTASLSGGSSPTGMITFKLYGPSATAGCSGTPLSDQTVAVSGNSSYTTPAGVLLGQAGTYWWTASYGGDAGNTPAASGCGAEQVIISPLASPTFSTTPTPGGPVGALVLDTAALLGGSSPTGTITFNLYGPSATANCSGTPVDTETVTVTGNGGYSTPAGATPSQAGTYWWTASYSGDARNNPAASGCGAEQVTISKVTLGFATGAGPGGPVGTLVIDFAALEGGDNPTGTITFNLYGPSATASCSGTPVDTETVTVTGNGSYRTPAGATPSQAGTYWWTASYSGDTNNAPAVSGCGQESVTLSP